MARGGPSRLPSKKQSKDYNAKQAQARKEKKRNDALNGPSSIHDVFEYVTKQEEDRKNAGSRSEKRDNRVRRRAEVNSTDQEEVFRKGGKEGANDSDEDEDEDDIERYRRQTALTWREGSDGEEQINVVRSEDDEEIDSDEAFGESDEEKFEGWKFGARSDLGRRGAFNEEDEGEDDKGEEDDEDMMDLSRMLEDSDSEEDSEEDSDGSSEDEDRLRAKMENFGSTSGTKRQAGSDEETSALRIKRRLLPERSEAISEGQYNVPSRGAGSDTLITIEDLLDPLKEQSGTAFTSLRKTAKALARKDDASQAVASKKGGGALQAPLPSILQDRIDRSAAYEETRQEVQGWQPTIKRIREAEHLSFPLQPDVTPKVSTSLMTSQFKASNAFERDIAAMLEKEGISERKLAEMEELKMNERGMSAEEIQERRNDLRKMRDLIFREEQKAKRVSKIKSKTYRKIARKQREKDLEKAKAAGVTLEQGDDDDNEEIEKAARLRAKERATLKHKNTGKWAKNMIGLQGSKDMPEARNAIEEQLRRGEQLRRRIQGQISEDEVSEDDEGSEGFGSESDDENNVFDELRSVAKKNDLEREKDEEEMQGKKGVWSMEFMKKARAQKAKQTQGDVEQLERELKQLERSDREDDDAATDEDEVIEGRTNGRMIFDSKAATLDTEAIHRDSANDDNSIETVKMTSPTVLGSLVVLDVRDKTNTPEDDAANPWLSAKPVSKLSRKKNEITVSKEGSAISKAANKISKHIARGEEEKKLAEKDAHLEIDPEAMLKFKSKQSGVVSNQLEVAKKNRADKSKGEDQEVDHASDSDNDSVEEAVAIRGKGPAAITQRDLVAEAFAGDDVTAAFEAEKQAMIEADAPQIIDTTLPGWGSWGGKGIRVNKKKAEEQKKKFAKVIPGLDPTKRKDANMVNVIINQKKDKKADRYRGKDVPYPYTSRAQYEMAMRNPLGPEWNTRTQHQRLTLPRVVTKPGKAIKPIEKLF